MDGSVDMDAALAAVEMQQVSAGVTNVLVIAGHNKSSFFLSTSVYGTAVYRSAVMDLEGGTVCFEPLLEIDDFDLDMKVFEDIVGAHEEMQRDEMNLNITQKRVFSACQGEAQAGDVFYDKNSSLNGYRFSWNQLIQGLVKSGDPWWDMKEDGKVAFSMVCHKRLGENSIWNSLEIDLLKMIVEMLKVRGSFDQTAFHFNFDSTVYSRAGDVSYMIELISQDLQGQAESQFSIR
eukprot:745827-Hanusia_phi.AAC.1